MSPQATPHETSDHAEELPSYARVFLAFLRNSLVRDMTFRWNFLIECVSSVGWVLMNLGFYVLVFQFADTVGHGTGWGQYEFFVFLATTMIINSLVQTFFMPNCEEFSEMIRTGGLDIALLKPIDTQFLISLHKVDWSSLSNLGIGLVLLSYSLWKLMTRAPDPLVLELAAVILYPVFVLAGVAILYSLMITLAATSIWLGRNQALYDFWFYITTFSRYPMEIYRHSRQSWGAGLWFFFTFVVPILVVVNVPARLLAQPLQPRAWWEWPLTGFGALATIGSLVLSRWIFQRALASYRSASS
jgi:ABC-2 type transport system permease protein